jgi:hypothetical protein
MTLMLSRMCCRWKLACSSTSWPASAREVQHVVHQAQQRLRGELDLVQVAALAQRQRRLFQQPRQADDGVHRRADFVAHVGQEFALGAAASARSRATISSSFSSCKCNSVSFKAVTSETSMKKPLTAPLSSRSRM